MRHFIITRKISAELEFDGSNTSDVNVSGTKDKNSWRNMLKRIGFTGNRSETGVGIKRAP